MYSGAFNVKEVNLWAYGALAGSGPDVDALTRRYCPLAWAVPRCGYTANQIKGEETYIAGCTPPCDALHWYRCIIDVDKLAL